MFSFFFELQGTLVGITLYSTINIRNQPRVAHHNGGNSVRRRQRDCHTLGKPSGLTVICFPKPTESGRCVLHFSLGLDQRPCFALACLSKYDRGYNAKPSYEILESCKTSEGNAMFFSQNLTLAPFLAPRRLQSSYWNEDLRTGQSLMIGLLAEMKI